MNKQPFAEQGASPRPPLLERKGLCTKQDLYDIISEFRRKNPRAKIPQTAFPEPYLLTETENTIIDDILELLNTQGLTSHQSMNLLERLARIIEMGQRLPKGPRTNQEALWDQCHSDGHVPQGSESCLC